MLDAQQLTAPLLALAYLTCTAGFGWLALAMDVHWQQLRGDGAPLAPAHVRKLRLLGIAGLAMSLALCLVADHTSIASLVWVMTLATSALSITLALTWRPKLLSPLIAWAS